MFSITKIGCVFDDLIESDFSLIISIRAELCLTDVARRPTWNLTSSRVSRSIRANETYGQLDVPTSPLLFSFEFSFQLKAFTFISSF